MEGNIEAFKPRERWENETAERGSAVVEFLKNYRNSRIDDKKDRYDEFLDLHCSGGSWEVLTKVSHGDAKLIAVEVFYKDDKLEKIKVLFDGEGEGNVEFSIMRRALQDLLEIGGTKS